MFDKSVYFRILVNDSRVFCLKYDTFVSIVILMPAVHASEINHRLHSRRHIGRAAAGCLAYSA